MEEAAAAQDFERAALYRDRLKAVRSLFERQRVAGGSVGTADLIGGRGRGDRRQRPGLPGPRRHPRRAPGLLPARTRRGGDRDPGEVAEEFIAPVLLGAAPAMPRPVVVGPELRGRTERARRGAGRASATRRSRCGSPSAATSAACASSPSATPARPRPGPAAPRAPPPAPGRVALRAAGGARDGASCRSGSRASTSPTSAASTPSPRWSSSRAARRRSPTTAGSASAASSGERRRPRRLRLDGGGPVAAAEPLPRAGRPLAARRRARRELRRAARPDRDRRRQGPALGRDAGAASRFVERGVTVISLAKRLEEVFVPGRSRRRSCSSRTRRPRGCCSGSATRRTASRSTTTAAAATRR